MAKHTLKIMWCEHCFNDQKTSDHKYALGLRANKNFKKKLVFTN